MTRRRLRHVVLAGIAGRAKSNRLQPSALLPEEQGRAEACSQLRVRCWAASFTSLQRKPLHPASDRRQELVASKARAGLCRTIRTLKTFRAAITRSIKYLDTSTRGSGAGNMAALFRNSFQCGAAAAPVCPGPDALRGAGVAS